jgi:ornithine cyclodeaminase/alanine dehydrogenase-like protein (mu-crystallin family)
VILYINESEVRSLVSMADAVACLDAAFSTWGEGDAVNMPRRRLPLPGGKQLNYMAATVPAADGFGYKAYFSNAAGRSQLVMLYSISEGRLAAMIEAGTLGRLRTGAASGIATRYLAREDSEVVGVIGSGTHARTQLEAMAAVRPIKSALVYSRSAERREAYAREMSEQLGIDVAAVASGAEAVGGADIVVTATKPGMNPVLLGDWIAPGTHINAMGANAANQRELDDDLLLKSDLVVVDDIAQSMIEATELMALTGSGKIDWADVRELGDIVQGRAPGRSAADDITLFNSLGMAFEDIAFGRMIYERALAGGVGKQLDVP